MSDRKNEELSLRAIAVSGRAALEKADDAEGRERLRRRVHDLLADLEDEIIRDGADEDLLMQVEEERHRVWR